MVSPKKRPTELVDMGKLMSGAGVDPLVLCQVSGPGPTRKVRVAPFEEVVLGRDSDCEVVLEEGPVSRAHAKVVYHDYQAELHDLGSTNGTFLNGKRVHRAFLKEGDQIQVGANIFELRLALDDADADADANADADAPSDVTSDSRVSDLQSRLRERQENPPRQSSAISGRLSEIRLTSVLQIIESDRATGTLVIRRGGREGKLHVHQGMARHATLGRTRGVKALYRLMALDEGDFELYIPGRSPEYDTIEGDLQKHLLEAMRQKDEVAVLREQLPPADTRLGFVPEKAIPISRVPPPVFDVMASVSRYHNVGDVIEYCNLPDFEICRVLIALMKHGILTVEPVVPTSSAS